MTIFLSVLTNWQKEKYWLNHLCRPKRPHLKQYFHGESIKGAPRPLDMELISQSVQMYWSDFLFFKTPVTIHTIQIMQVSHKTAIKTPRPFKMWTRKMHRKYCWHESAINIDLPRIFKFLQVKGNFSSGNFRCHLHCSLMKASESCFFFFYERVL